MIKFGDLQSDLPTYQNTGALKADNVIPLKEGYKSFPGFVELSDTALNSVPVGLFTSIGATGITNYAGDETMLYQMDQRLVVTITPRQKDQETFGVLLSLETMLLELTTLITYKNFKKEQIQPLAILFL